MTDQSNSRMYLFLLIMNIAAYVGYQSWRSMFNNFAVEIGNVDGYQMGIIQSLREVPGFLALLVILAIIMLPEHKLAPVSIIVLGAGVGLTGFLPSFYGLIITTMIMSFGFHYYETVNQSLTIQYFDKRTSPIVFSRLRSISAGTNIIAGVMVILLLKFIEYKYIYFVAGVLVVIAGIYCLTLDPTDPNKPVQKKKLYLKKKYWLYYVLTFLSGARRQIFVAFSVFLMVEKFNFSATEVAGLFIVNNAVNYFFNPLIGKGINRFGERRMLSLEYGTLIFVFTAYALTDSKLIVAGLYIIDHIVFNFAISIRTFYQKIADPEDFANGMAMGFTINHIAAVFIPVAGGALWLLDYRISFFSGVILAVCSLIFVQMIDREVAKAEGSVA
ncbi:major facilitator superfamily MFS_1 [Denitrovibrio acetiphilus DSM 12809]|uniref:Major facilitator superfamily MFS_1 n=1 Tax=Denitrovibrio acetiphilus (strain DSM 12809 / NBRC 114555 / N2460) TaxID=522772 RepID=D4H7X8_DENA2|nr:MFS transporter [Denitrovibrio acetiphilus]ADD68127.1 major facilitator superfamily MFS_1 [Denitrovibrio acetiphilus DSM 12809]